MATVLSLPRVNVSLQWSQTKTLTAAVASTSNSFTWSKSYTNGAGAGQVNRIHFAQGTIAASSNLDIDLAGSLQDIFGDSVVFARIKLLYVELLTDTAASSVLVGGATNAVASLFGAGTHTIRVQNGGVLMLGSPTAAGYTVTASTADILRVTNEDASNVATYRLAIVGAAT